MVWVPEDPMVVFELMKEWDVGVEADDFDAKAVGLVRKAVVIEPVDAVDLGLLVETL